MSQHPFLGIRPRSVVLKMKKRIKRIQAILIIALSFSLTLFSTYILYHNLAQADFLSSDLSFENPDQEDLFIRQQAESKLFVSNPFSILFLPGVNLFGHLPYFSFSTPSFDQKALILRC